ncbi:Pentafunctional AROM polypeptide [Verticillium dahliae VDG2]|nr:Pentafunctional AROM polypeptide [Verticillium dahliae VDG2]
MKNGPADGSSPAQGPPYDPTTGFPSTGVLPVVPPDLLPDKNPRSNAATAASAAGVRALSAQAIAFYFRAPVKAFFRTRVDYLAWARSLEHWDHLEDIDQKTATMRADAAARGGAPARGSIFRIYYHAYQETWAQCEAAAAAQGRSVRSWLYRGFWWNTIRQVPSTSAGLIIFELVRRKYGLRSDEVRINKDGYDIQLN